MKKLVKLAALLVLLSTGCVSPAKFTPSQAAELGETPTWLGDITEITINGQVISFTATTDLYFIPSWGCWVIEGVKPHPKPKKAAKGTVVEVWMTYYPATQQGFLLGSHKYTKVGTTLRCLPAYTGDACFDDITIEE